MIGHVLVILRGDLMGFDASVLAISWGEKGVNTEIMGFNGDLR